MKKLLTIMLSVLMVFGLTACGGKDDDNGTDEPTNGGNEVVEVTAKDDYASFMAADVDAEVEVLMYVQAHQAWWEKDGQGVMTLYGMDKDGGYFVYEAKIDKEAADSIKEGTLVKVTGVKAEWAGEVEIMDATVEVLGETKTFEAKDVTDVVADSEKLAEYMNQKVAIKGLEVVEVATKDSEYDPDLYITCKLGDTVVNLCVENYLTGPDTEVYMTGKDLTAGTVIDVEGFLYWYEGANPHVTSISVVK